MLTPLGIRIKPFGPLQLLSATGQAGTAKVQKAEILRCPTRSPPQKPLDLVGKGSGSLAWADRDARLWSPRNVRTFGQYHAAHAAKPNMEMACFLKNGPP